MKSFIRHTTSSYGMASFGLDDDVAQRKSREACRSKRTICAMGLGRDTFGTKIGSCPKANYGGLYLSSQ